MVPTGIYEKGKIYPRASSLWSSSQLDILSLFCNIYMKRLGEIIQQYDF